MSKYFYSIIIISVGSLILFRCNPPEPLSTVPKISLNDVYYKEIDGGQDSLVVMIDFEDGDGDLGLDPTETFHPYHDYELIINDTLFVTLGDENGGPPYYVTTPTYFFAPGVEPIISVVPFSDVDNRPEYNCQDYEILYIHESKKSVRTKEAGDAAGLEPPDWALDTLYVYRNEDRHNIYVDFFRKIGDNEYEFIDWTRAFDVNGCGLDFNARFPIFDEDNIGSSLEGTIKYTMRSAGFNLILRQDEFKLVIHIQDRDLNESNIIETEDMTLADLLRVD